MNFSFGYKFIIQGVKMKIDRLLGIITYLMNRDIVTAKELAKRFEVTERTIQRDVESINSARIPIVSLRGTNGGYKILDHFKFSKQTLSQNDLSSIRLALESMKSVCIVNDYSDLIEKVDNINKPIEGTKVSVDFGVAKENKKVVENYKTLNEAINVKRKVLFEYVNAMNNVSQKIIEPISLNFKWYSWYLVGYKSDDKAYRIYKLSRISNLSISEFDYDDIHNGPECSFDNLMKGDNRKATKLKIKCSDRVFIGFNEYFQNLEVIEKNEGYYSVILHVIEEERMWFAFMLSFGNDIEIIEPNHIRKRMYDHSKKIIDIYKIPDR